MVQKVVFNGKSEFELTLNKSLVYTNYLMALEFREVTLEFR